MTPKEDDFTRVAKMGSSGSLPYRASRLVVAQNQPENDSGRVRTRVLPQKVAKGLKIVKVPQDGANRQIPTVQAKGWKAAFRKAPLPRSSKQAKNDPRAGKRPDHADEQTIYAENPKPKRSRADMNTPGLSWWVSLDRETLNAQARVRFPG